MKTPSRTFIILVLAVIATVSVIIFQACATQSDGARDGNKFFVKIGKDENTFVEFVQPGGKEKFDKVLRRLASEQYSIRYKKDDLRGTQVDNDYHPPTVSLKTDKVTTSELAKNEPIGDPNVTKKVQSNKVTDIKDVLDALK
jgi:hypothetical protein